MSPKVSDGQLLMPAAQAARKMGISRRTLKRRIDANEIKAVKVGPRLSIPQSEMNRIVNGEPALKPAAANSNFCDGAEHGQALSGTPKPTENEPQTLTEIMAMPIHFEERWKLLHASKLSRDEKFLQAILDLVWVCENKPANWPVQDAQD